MRIDSTFGSGRFVQANGLEIYYEEYGEGQPLVVVHGGTVTIRRYSLFGEHYRVYAPNTRGHGRTVNPTGEFSYALLADDLAAFIQAIGLERPLIAGYSDGGNIALQLGMSWPDQARALAVGGIAYRFTPTYLNALRAQFGFGEGDPPELEHVVDLNRDMVEYWEEAHAALGSPDYWKTLVHQMWPMWTTPLGYTREDFGRITVPVLILIGDRDEIVPVEDATELYRLIPNAELSVVPGANHVDTVFGPLYQPSVLDFLSRHGLPSSVIIPRDAD